MYICIYVYIYIYIYLWPRDVLAGHGPKIFRANSEANMRRQKIWRVHGEAGRRCHLGWKTHHTLKKGLLGKIARKRIRSLAGLVAAPFGAFWAGKLFWGRCGPIGTILGHFPLKNIFVRD